MTLLSVLAQYSQAQSRLETLLKGKNPSAADLTFLMRQTNDLRDQIIAEDPHTQDEAARKLGCLLNLMRRESQIVGIDPELDRLLASAAETCEDFLSRASNQSTPPRLSPMPSPSSGKGQAIFGGSMADYVAFSESRVSLIDTNYRYVATSEENARFYKRQQIAIMGCHVADLIGEHRFQTRAKLRLDACFKGEKQSYHHALNHQREARIMRCDMHPVNSAEGTILGAMVYLTDITDQVRKLRPTADVLVHQVRQTSNNPVA